MSDKSRYHICPSVIVGYRCPWSDPRIYETTRYCSFINRICGKDRYIDKRGFFLASSSNKEYIVDELHGRLLELNLALGVTKWTKRESIETGRIFCHKVCPKIIENLWMIAEVSDFNPNVFFESGFALGLGRKVIFLGDEQAGSIKSKLGDQEYYSYKTVEDFVNQLNFSSDIFRNIEIKSIYGVPRDFEYVDNFDSPSDREKNNEVYVLSFNHETNDIKKLSDKYGYRIVELYRLNQDFMPSDLVEELINSQAVLVNLAGVQKGETLNKIQDSQLMCLAGICVSQGIPVKIFQSNRHFYSDVHKISTDSIEQLIDFVRASRV